MTRTPHLLIVDDDREIRALLARFLGQHGFRVTQAQDGRAMALAMRDGRFDLIVLDLMLPGEDGLTLCRKLRAESDVPVIMLTAMAEDTDRIVGLEIGADDYLTKPFNPRELLARAKAVLRRAGPGVRVPEAPRSPGFAFAGWELRVAMRELRAPDGTLVQLTSGEFDLLLAFVERPQRVLNRDQLLDVARGRSAVMFDRSMDVQISRLRRKIEPDPTLPALIKTVRNGGYIFTPEVAKLDSVPSDAASGAAEADRP